MISNSGNMLSSIHKEILDKFALSITPIASPNSNTEEDEEEEEMEEELQSIEQTSMPFEDELEDEQEYIEQEEIYDHCAAQMDVGNVETIKDSNSIEMNSFDEENSTCLTNESVMNYTIIGNGLIVIDGTEIEIDEETSDSNKLVQSGLQFVEGLDLFSLFFGAHNLSNGEFNFHFFIVVVIVR